MKYTEKKRKRLAHKATNKANRKKKGKNKDLMNLNESTYKNVES